MRRKRLIVALAVVLFLVIASSAVVYMESGSLMSGEDRAGSSFERGIWQFTLMLNTLITMLLVVLIFRNLIKLYFERKHKKVGTKLRTKLVIAFVSFSLIPSIFLYMLASGLVRETFGQLLIPDVERVYQQAVDIASFYHGHDVNRAERWAKMIAELVQKRGLLSASRHDELAKLVSDKVREYGLGGAQVLKGDEEITRVSEAKALLTDATFKFNRERIGLLLKSEKSRIVENLSVNKADVISCAAPVKSPEGKVLGAVIVKYVVPPQISLSKEQVSSSIMRYRLFSTKEVWKQKVYVALVLIITLLIIFAATWFGFYVAKVMTDPIERLLKGLQSVARGDFGVHLSGEKDDEMGLLVNAFNKMAADLKASKTAVNKAENQLSRSSRDYDRRRRHMESILSNIATGVVSFNVKGKITIINEAALSILR